MIKSLGKKVLGYLGLGRSREGEIPMTVRQMRNFLYYAEIFGKLKDVNGAIVECGVGKGRSFLYFNFLASQEATNRRVWGFDSFEGFPEPTSEDVSLRNPKKGDWGDARVTHIEQILKKASIPSGWRESNVKLVKGFFDATLSSYDGAPIALLHVDADLYESYKDVLTTLYPLVSKGGAVLFDEYNEPKWPGAKQAVDEFFADKGLTPIRHEGSGKYYLFKN